MLSINTNLSSIIAQNSMRESTNALNLAIERMTTGFKINRAKDNAANCSISTNMSTKLGAYQIAEDNASMGLDMLNTASESISLISSGLKRLRSLAEQAVNGTYGEGSLKSINAEANAIVDEMEKITQCTEYNKIKLFKPQEIQSVTDPDAGIPKVNIKDITNFTDVSTDTIIQISDETGLRKLATMVNAGQNTSGRTFKMTNDITLTQDFTPIGWYDSTNDIYRFYGTFDGCGYTIRNLKINATKSYVGLFGLISNANIKNIIIDNAVITSRYNNTGIIVGSNHYNSIIENCAVSGTINGSQALNVGGISGWSGGQSIINNCSFEGEINDADTTGGISGAIGGTGADILNCYAKVVINSSKNFKGGIVGCATKSLIKNCFAEGSITGGSKNGGISGGDNGNSIFQNCYSIVTVPQNTSGSIIGHSQSTTSLKNCYATSSYSLWKYGSSPNITQCFTSSYDLKLASTFSAWTNEVNDFGDPLWIIKDGETPTLNTGYANIKDNVPIISESNTSNALDENQRHFKTSLQIGINNNQNSSIEVAFLFTIEDFDSFRNIGLDNENYLSKIDSCSKQILDAETTLGAAQNRLESALEEISVQYDNLVSSRSTLRDADIAKVSSHYIQQQILQQASATLMATANQTPSIALQLI